MRKGPQIDIPQPKSERRPYLFRAAAALIPKELA
jgi:hypothetical protein